MGYTVRGNEVIVTTRISVEALLMFKELGYVIRFLV